MTESDHDLIRACIRGDVGAWEQVLDRYERLVFSVALRNGLGREDAADVTQTTFTILMQSLEKLREDTRLSAWLATVARRQAWRLAARLRREPLGIETDVAEQDGLHRQPGDAVESWERVEWLRAGLERLNARCRELIKALYFEREQPSYAQIAERFSMPVGSVGPTRARCLEKLKTHMTRAAAT